MQTNDWIGWFDQVFTEISKMKGWSPLLASGCREGWIQGEFHRQFSKDYFWVNTTRIGDRKTVDFSWFEEGASKDQPGMIAELKLVLNDAYTTGLSGRRNLAEIEERFIRPNKKVDLDFLTEIVKKPAKDSVMRDIYRLYKAKQFGPIDKFMIVVLPRYKQSEISKLHELLGKIDFEMAEECFDSDPYAMPDEMAEFTVRIWKIKN